MKKLINILLLSFGKSRLIKALWNYAEARVDRAQYEIQKRITHFIVQVLIFIGFIFVFFFLILFASMALANYTSYWMVSILYLLVAIILILGRKRIHRKLVSYIQRQRTDSKNEDDEIKKL